MIDTNKLQKKGIPITRDQSKNIIDSQALVKDKTIPLQFMVSEKIFEEFSDFSGRKFGFKKGAKSKLFLEVWKFYKSKIKW